MKETKQRDDKNRMRLGIEIKKNFAEGVIPRIVFLGDHMVVCDEDKFEDMVEELGSEIGSNVVARTVLTGESLDCKTDEQGRFSIPTHFLTGALAENDYYVLSVQEKGKNNYIDIFPKSVYDELIENFFEGTTFLKQSGLKGRMSSYKEKTKGEGDEERRREN